MLWVDPVSNNYFYSDEETIGSCIKKIVSEWNDLKGELTVKLEREQMETKKNYLSVELLDNSEKVMIKINPEPCYGICKLFDVFDTTGIRSENVSLRILENIADHIIEMVYDSDINDDLNLILAMAYRIAVDFIESGADKCMWDITDNEHIVKIDPCKDCGYQCQDISEEDEDNDQEVSAIEKEISDLKQQISRLKNVVFPEGQLSVLEQINLLRINRNNIVRGMTDHDTRLRELEDRLTRSEALNDYFLIKTNK